MKVAAKIILINNDNKVLLQLRDENHSHAGYWALFGGHINSNETPEAGLVREIKEEINYELKSFELLKVSMVKSFGQVYWYKGKIDVELSDLILREGDDFKFFSYSEILKLKISPASKKVLIDFYENKD